MLAATLRRIGFWRWRHERLFRRANTSLASVDARPTPNDGYDVLFFGSDEVSVATLARLNERRLAANAKSAPKLVKSIGVVCPSSSSPSIDDHLPVARYAKQHQLRLFFKPRIVSMEEFQLPLQEYNFGIVVSFGYFLPQRVLRSFQYGSINMHPSLLPKYRGAAPIYHALLNDDAETGVSIITLDPTRFDVGAVLDQRRIAIERDERYASLAARLASLGADATLDVLAALPDRFANARPQQGAASRAPRLSRSDAAVRWRERTARQVWSQYRALVDSWGVHTYHQARRVKLVAARAPDVVASQLDALGLRAAVDAALSMPGAFYFERRLDALLVRCADGALLGVESLLVEGHAPVSARQFCVGLKTPGALRMPSSAAAALHFDDALP